MATGELTEGTASFLGKLPPIQSALLSLLGAFLGSLLSLERGCQAKASILVQENSGKDSKERPSFLAHLQKVSSRLQSGGCPHLVLGRFL